MLTRVAIGLVVLVPLLFSNLVMGAVDLADPASGQGTFPLVSAGIAAPIVLPPEFQRTGQD